MKLVTIIPALNEEETVGQVVADLIAVNLEGLAHIVIVVDNGSTDDTAVNAENAGALVVREPDPGYGRACLRGLSEIADADIVLFVDADGSDDPSEYPLLLEPLLRGEADFVMGSRTRGVSEQGALSAHQRLGNALAVTVLNYLYGSKYSDLGPFRAIRADALRELGMSDQDFGWTLEMQIKVARNRLRIAEVPVSYRRRRSGKSKISGSLVGSVRAGFKILRVLFRHIVRDALEQRSSK